MDMNGMGMGGSPPQATNAKKKRRTSNTQRGPPSLLPPPYPDYVPPPLSGLGDTVVASNPFEDIPPPRYSIPTGPPPVYPGPPNRLTGNNTNNNNNPMLPRMSTPSISAYMNQMGPTPSYPGMRGNIPQAPVTYMNNHMNMNLGRMMNCQSSGSMMNGINNQRQCSNSNLSLPGPSGNMNNGARMPGLRALLFGNNASNRLPRLNNPRQPMMNHCGQIGSMGHLIGNQNQVMNNIQNPMVDKIFPPDQPMVFNQQNPYAPPISPCGICRKEVHANEQAIFCESGCNFWFHRRCTGLTEKAYELLMQEAFAEWVCDRCIQMKNVPLVKFKP